MSSTDSVVLWVIVAYVVAVHVSTCSPLVEPGYHRLLNESNGRVPPPHSRTQNLTIENVDSNMTAEITQVTLTSSDKHRTSAETRKRVDIKPQPATDSARTVTEDLSTRPTARTTTAAVQNTDTTVARQRLVNGVPCVDVTRGGHGETAVDTKETERRRRLKLDLNSLGQYGCPFSVGSGNNNLDSSRMAACARIFEGLCGAAMYAHTPPLSLGRKADPMSCKALVQWGTLHIGNCYRHISVWTGLHFNSFYIPGALETWHTLYRSATKHVCDNVLPNVSEPIPCSPVAGQSCECPWSIMPEMCQHLLWPWPAYHHLQVYTHHLVIKYGIPCHEDWGWSELRCRTFQALHRDYRSRMLALGCVLPTLTTPRSTASDTQPITN